MKKIISLSMFLLFCSGDLKSVDQSAVAPKKSCALDCEKTLCCDRGPQGPRGKRGRRGPAGPDATAGLNELFLIAEMMYPGIIEGPILPVVFHPYGAESDLLTWRLASGDFLFSISTTFPLPLDMDLSQPVTFVIHVFTNSLTPVTGNVAAVGFDLSIKSNGDLLGDVPPGTGPQFFLTSPDFTVAPAVPAASDNLRQFMVSIPVTLTGITPGEWVYIRIGRAPATGNDYSGSLFLSTVSVQYQRLVS